MKLKAFAKVNLILKIFKKQPNDSKHKIQSLFALNTKIYDLIKIKKSRALEIKYFDAEKKEIKIDNCLIKKTTQYLKNKFDFSIDYKIEIFKKIPLLSGMAGGSSDAASIIKYLCKENKKKLNQNELKDIALNLGSDIPFFITKNKLAIVSSYGEKIQRQKKLNIKYLVETTNEPISTKKIYEKLEKDHNYKSQVNFKKLLNEYLNKEMTFNNIYNDLEKYICISNKNLKSKLEKYKQQNGTAFLSGAGGTIVVIKGK